MNPDETAIRKLVVDWLAASKAGDTATALTLMTDDVVFLTAGQEPFGKSKFAEMAKSHAEHAMTFDGGCEVVDLKLVGEWAFMISRLRVIAMQPGAPAMARAGHTLTVLRKEGGQWRIARDANLLVPVGTGGD